MDQELQNDQNDQIQIKTSRKTLVFKTSGRFFYIQFGRVEFSGKLTRDQPCATHSFHTSSCAPTVILFPFRTIGLTSAAGSSSSASTINASELM